MAELASESLLVCLRRRRTCRTGRGNDLAPLTADFKTRTFPSYGAQVVEENGQRVTGDQRRLEMWGGT